MSRSLNDKAFEKVQTALDQVLDARTALIKRFCALEKRYKEAKRVESDAFYRYMEALNKDARAEETRKLGKIYEDAYEVSTRIHKVLSDCLKAGTSECDEAQNNFEKVFAECEKIVEA